MLKSKKLRRLVVALVAGATLAVVLLWSATSLLWVTWDYQVLDFFYKEAVQEEKGPPTSPLPFILAITDDTYAYFQSNVLGREKLAQLNRVLTKLMPQAVAYDIIFARPSNPNADLLFEQSIQELGIVYLPVAFGGSDPPRPFPWEEGAAYDRLREAIQAGVEALAYKAEISPAEIELQSAVPVII